MVWCIHRREVDSYEDDDRGKTELTTAKNRNGVARNYRLEWDAPTTTFRVPAREWEAGVRRQNAVNGLKGGPGAQFVTRRAAGRPLYAQTAPKSISEDRAPGQISDAGDSSRRYTPLGTSTPQTGRG